MGSKTMSLEDFHLGAVLHRGTFSTIQVVKAKPRGMAMVGVTSEDGSGGGRIFVLKSLESSHHVFNKSQYLLDAEMEIRSENASQWIVGLQYYFQDERRTHFVMEYLPGGNFVSLLKMNGGYMEEAMAMFYMGELVLAINAVHCIGFAHRNVKPENILLDGRGHIKISGFGSASKIGMDGKVSFPIQVDSASYEAPEILRTLGNADFTYGIECDFWSFGVIAFETITGVHPFRSSSPLSAFKKITTKKVKGAVKIPAKLSQECKDLIAGLLLEQKDRLTYEDCISHPFFNELIWDGLRSEIAPLTPIIRTEEVEGLGGDDDENEMNCGDTEGTYQKITNLTFTRPSQAQIVVDEVIETAKKVEDDNSVWSVTSVVDSHCHPQKSIVISQRATEDEKLRSELQIKTEQLMEKLHQIQILQTQLQKSNESLECNEKLLSVSKKENERLKVEMEYLSAQLANERSVREGLENKLNNANISALRAPAPLVHLEGLEADSDEMFELKDQVFKLMESSSQKDDIILDMNVRLKIVQHELRVQRLENQLMFRRDEASINIFAEAYKQTITEMRLKLNEMDKLATQKRENGNIEDESKIKMFIESKTQEIADLYKKIGEIQVAHDKKLKDANRSRKEIAEVFGIIQVKVDRAFQEYS